MNRENNTDVGWKFPPQFESNGKDVTLVSGEDEIEQALEILLTTSLNERFNYPDYGCDMKKFMFEEINHGLANEIQEIIYEAIMNHEERIILKEIEITEPEDTSYFLLIEITYIIIETEEEITMEYSFSLY